MSHQEHFFPERMPAVFTSSKSTVIAIYATEEQDVSNSQTEQGVKVD